MGELKKAKRFGSRCPSFQRWLGGCEARSVKVGGGGAMVVVDVVTVVTVIVDVQQLLMLLVYSGCYKWCLWTTCCCCCCSAIVLEILLELGWTESDTDDIVAGHIGVVANVVGDCGVVAGQGLERHWHFCSVDPVGRSTMQLSLFQALDHVDGRCSVPCHSCPKPIQRCMGFVIGRCCQRLTTTTTTQQLTIF